jgi:hypothetical protein
MLKQESFFKKLKQKKISLQGYFLLYKLHEEKTLTDKYLEYLKEKHPLYIGSDNLISPIGVKLIKDVDALFTTRKKLSAIEVLGEGFQENLEKYLEIFPTQKLPSGKYARGNKKNVETNMMWFFQEYDFTWDTILKATKLYVEEYFRKNYLYMRTAMFFIKKEDGTKAIQSELANYCDMVLSKTDYIEERTFKARVV